MAEQPQRVEPVTAAGQPAPPVPAKVKRARKPKAKAVSRKPAPPAPQTPEESETLSSNERLQTLFTDSLRRNTDVKPADDVGMRLVQAIAQLVTEAKPVSGLEENMIPHLGEMPSKIHLMLNAFNYHNLFERGALYSLARWTLEKSLWQDLMNNQLAPPEKLALLQLAIKEMDKVETRLTDYKEDLDTSGRGTVADIQSTSEKVDRSTKKEDLEAAKALEGTSAVGREVARRMLDKANSVLNARAAANSK